MPQLRIAGLGLLLAAFPAAAQTSISACGPLPDSTAKQSIKVFDGLRVCLLATRVTDPDATMPQDWAAKGATVVLETQRDGDNRRAAIDGNRVTWTINGRPAPMDTIAERWQKAVINLLDLRFEADALREQSASLRADIDSLPSRRAALRKRITLIEGRQRALDQQLLAVRATESRRRSDLANLERQRDDYQRRANAEERAATTARDDRARAAAEANARRYHAEANRIGEHIRRIELGYSNESRKLAEIEDELRALSGDGGLTLLRMRLANYDSTDVRDLEQQLTQLDAPRRLSDLEARIETARRELVALLEARGTAPSR